jgi:hypothetical protein
MASLLPTLLLVGATVSPAHASIAAWWNGYGTQVMLLNSTTNQIRYSTCNSQDEPRYSYTDGSVLSLSHKPKPGTPLAGTGWWDESKTMYMRLVCPSPRAASGLTRPAALPCSTSTTKATSSTPCSTAT